MSGGRVVGLGIDLVEVDRVERAHHRWGERLVGKIMGPAEAGRLATGAARPLALAVAVALKEAASKAIGTGWSRGVAWRDVVVDPGPPPRVSFERGALAFARRLGSSGASTAVAFHRDGLVVAEVRLLS